MPTWKELLLREASKRFEEQKKQERADDGNVSRADVSYMAPISPSPPALIDEALDRLNFETISSTGEPVIKDGALFVDLGCGDGRWLIKASEKFHEKQIRCVGYDLDSALLEKARAKADSLDITLHKQDLMLADVSNASVVIAYLFREGCAAVRDKLERELSSDRSAVLSVGFSLRGWEPRWILRMKGCVPLYFYTPPWRERLLGKPSHPVAAQDNGLLLEVRIRDFRFHPDEFRCKAGGSVVFIRDCDGPQAHLVAVLGGATSTILSSKGDRWTFRVPDEGPSVMKNGHEKMFRIYDPFFDFMTASLSVMCPARGNGRNSAQHSYLGSLLSELD